MTTEELLELYWQHLAAPVYYNNKVRPRLYALEYWKAHYNQMLMTSNATINVNLDVPDSKVWIWSDLHFFHKNIIQYSNRPFADMDNMNHTLIHNFNSLVGPNDISIWVGDISFSNDNTTNELLEFCNGYKILIYGNHDFNHDKARKLNFNETHFLYKLDYDGMSLVFTHYPMYNLPKEYINIHGHIHKGGKYENTNDYSSSQHINVNCEFINYQPVRLDKLKEIVRLRTL